MSDFAVLQVSATWTTYASRSRWRTHQDLPCLCGDSKQIAANGKPHSAGNNAYDVPTIARNMARRSVSYLQTRAHRVSPSFGMREPSSSPAVVISAPSAERSAGCPGASALHAYAASANNR